MTIEDDLEAIFPGSRERRRLAAIEEQFTWRAPFAVTEGQDYDYAIAWPHGQLTVVKGNHSSQLWFHMYRCDNWS